MKLLICSRIFLRNSNQLIQQLSPLKQSFCDYGLGLVTFEALAGGLLTDKYLKEIPDDSRVNTVINFPKDRVEVYRERLKKIQPIANELNIPISHLALAWTLRLPEVSSSLMGASKPDQVISNAQASEVTLNKDVIEKIEVALKNN